jgi:HSP20 family molecular chaperone IbpA
MKLRLRHNSIRLRLTRSEVDRLQGSGLVEESVDFPQSRFVFSLESGSDVREISASFVDGRLSVTVPSEQCHAWATTEEVGIDAQFQGLSILIEKDWPCLHPSATEDADTFARP